MFATSRAQSSKQTQAIISTGRMLARIAATADLAVLIHLTEMVPTIITTIPIINMLSSIGSLRAMTFQAPLLSPLWWIHLMLWLYPQYQP